MMELRERLQQELPPLPRWLGLSITVATADRVVAELTVREELCTSGNIMHGGAIMAFADTVGALAPSRICAKGRERQRSRAKRISSPARRLGRG